MVFTLPPSPATPPDALSAAVALADVWPTRPTRLGFGACIASTRFALAVFNQLGITGPRPMPVTAMLYNSAAARLSTAGIPAVDWPAEAHSIAVGEGIGSGGGWDGHLVVRGTATRERRHVEWLADYDLGSFARPHVGIDTHPVVVAAGIEPCQRNVATGTWMYPSGGWAVFWQEHPANDRWQTSGAWNDDPDPNEVRAVAAAVRERLAVEE